MSFHPPARTKHAPRSIGCEGATPAAGWLACAARTREVAAIARQLQVTLSLPTTRNRRSRAGRGCATGGCFNYSVRSWLKLNCCRAPLRAVPPTSPFAFRPGTAGVAINAFVPRRPDTISRRRTAGARYQARIGPTLNPPPPSPGCPGAYLILRISIRLMRWRRRPPK